jgi:hypothetical protein
VQARRCWLDLLAGDMLPLPQHFAFAFRCPTERMAAGLTEFLRYAPYAGFVRVGDHAGTAEGRRWSVSGTTTGAIWSLSSLEHLFMSLRSAGSRYDSALEALALSPTPPFLT